MNLSPVLLAAFLALLFYLAESRSKWLFFILPLAFSMPTARSFIGPIPIYWYDCAAIAVLFFLYRTGFWSRQFPKVPPWIGGVAIVYFLFGVIVPIFRYGPLPEFGWTFGHQMTGWCLFFVGVAITMPRYSAYLPMLAKGMVAALGWLAVVAAVQWRNVGVTLYFNQIFYGDFYRSSEGEGYLTDQLMTANWADRAQGPFMNPSNLAIFSVLLLSLVLLMQRRLPKTWVWAAMLFAGVNVITSVSRQTMIAVCLAGLLYALFAPVAKSVRNIVAGAILVIVVLVGTGGSEMLGSRFGRVAEQGFEEANVVARLVLGPQRLATLFVDKPDLFFTGVGLDADKLAGRGFDMDANEAGFVSNSFLLSLYYTGIFGFILYVALWIWSFIAAMRASIEFRPMLVALVGAGIFLTFADNTIFKFEAITAWVALILGVVAASRAGASPSVSRRRPQPRPRPPQSAAVAP
jgi:hypothetical protein